MQRFLPTCKWKLLASLLAIASGPAAADSLNDMVQKLPPPAFFSNKSRDALEYCIGITMGDWLTPITLHGEHKVLLYGSPTASFSNAIYMLIEIDDLGDRRTVTFHAHKGWDEKTEALIQSCL